MDLNPVMLLALLVVPAVTAAVVALLGNRQAALIRWLCLSVTLLNLIMAFALVANFRRNISADTPTAATFQPKMVPGADPANEQTRTRVLRALGSAAKENPQLPAVLLVLTQEQAAALSAEPFRIVPAYEWMLVP